MLLPSYLAVKVADNVESAHVNNRGLVAGVREVHSAVPSRIFPTTIDVSTDEAFVCCDGKIVFHDPAYACVAGPNTKGQVALGGKAGLFIWQDGRLTRCLEKPIDRIAGIADDGSVAATLADGSSQPPTIVWPSDRTSDGRYRFGFHAPSDRPTIQAPDWIAEYSPDGGYIAYGNPLQHVPSGPTVRTPNGFWNYSAQRSGASPMGLTCNGYAVATRFYATAIWHNGAVLQRDFGSYSPFVPGSEGIHAVNGFGVAVGRFRGRATVWEGETRFDLGEATAGPKLNDAIAISDNGNVLATSGSTLYLLRRRG